MKKVIFSFLVLSFLTGDCFAQKVYNSENAEKRNVSGFHGINVATGIELFLMEGKNEDVAVSASKPEFRDKIITKVENGILKIYYEDKLSAHNTKKVKKSLKAWISYIMLDQLVANTGATVKIEGILKTASLKIKATTGAEITGSVNTEDLNVDQSTGSIITLNGSASKMDAEGSTGSLFKGVDLKTNTCFAKVSTGAGITITAQKELNVKANTGGFVKYKGDASIREITKNTGGSVSKI